MLSSVDPAGELMLKASGDVRFNGQQHQSLHEFHYHHHQGHRSVIIQSCDSRGFGHWDYGGSFQEDGDCGLLEVSG